MTTVRKAVIPAAGLSTRLLPATKAQPKVMLPVVDKPAMQYVVEEAVRAGLTDILIITGRSSRAVEDHFDRNFELEHYLDIRGKVAERQEMEAIVRMADIHYVRQSEPAGLGHAIGVARQHVGDEPFAVLLPDDLLDDRSTVLTDMLTIHADTGRPVLALKEVSDEEISGLGCVDPEPAGPNLVRVKSLVEKPAPGEAPSNLAVIGRYVFNPEIFDHIALVEPGKGGEIQITDAIAMELKEGVYGHVFEKGHFDTGNKLGYLRAVVTLALERSDIGPEFRRILRQVVDEG